MKLQIVISNQTNPYKNIAVENYLLSLAESEVITMYLWKNHKTVVIGQNQNPFSECNVSSLLQDKGYLMRRKTGGGAVYHDDGNINFSFIVPKDLYDLNKQFSVLQEAVRQYGLTVEVSGRNDLLCEGRKFSGNAFSKAKYQYLHHGTILIKGNVEDMKKYLLVKPSKLQKHGVKSVQSRVVNLNELADVTSENIVPLMIKAFEKVYNGKAVETSFDSLLEKPEVQNIFNEFASEEWIFGKWRNFVSQKSRQFDWGLVEISLDINQQENKINNLQIATDALDLNIIDQAKEILSGASTLSKPSCDNSVIQDIIDLIYE